MTNIEIGNKKTVSADWLETVKKVFEGDFPGVTVEGEIVEDILEEITLTGKVSKSDSYSVKTLVAELFGGRVSVVDNLLVYEKIPGGMMASGIIDGYDFASILQFINDFPIPVVEDSCYDTTKSLLLTYREELNEIQLPFQKRFQNFLYSIEGENFGSLESNREIAGIVQSIADRLNKVFRCVKCGEPSRLRFGQSGNSKNGMFYFEHVIVRDGQRRRTNHSGKSKIPLLNLVEPSEDIRKKVKIGIDD